MKLALHSWAKKQKPARNSSWKIGILTLRIWQRAKDDWNCVSKCQWIVGRIFRSKPNVYWKPWLATEAELFFHIYITALQKLPIFSAYASTYCISFLLVPVSALPEDNLANPPKLYFTLAMWCDKTLEVLNGPWMYKICNSKSEWKSYFNYS